MLASDGASRITDLERLEAQSVRGQQVLSKQSPTSMLGVLLQLPVTFTYFWLLVPELDTLRWCFDVELVYLCKTQRVMLLPANPTSDQTGSNLQTTQTTQKLLQALRFYPELDVDHCKPYFQAHIIRRHKKIVPNAPQEENRGEKVQNSPVDDE